ncbi:hypothetical protein CYMTET_18450 [Cymbomonas tetramitiformis]|uniref:cholesterol 7-desaturase n=1 Tax=Cymbomonas tetramitiformis TaxID=36881 RepID=A0AAE0L5X0_9CHLO|nr:hypothetical protein CYMTET_18450 [Cymbomonas tetramitiformis]
MGGTVIDMLAAQLQFDKLCEKLGIGHSVGVALGLLVWSLICMYVGSKLYSWFSFGREDERISDKFSQLQAEQHSAEERGKTYPQPYPNGWYSLIESHTVKRGCVVEVRAVGKVFAIFRGESGKLNVIDAYCPHLGANLAIGGKVKGECLSCPFHDWCIDGTGHVSHVPYSDNPPKLSNIKQYTYKEYYGMVVLWHDIEGGPPAYELPDFEEIDKAVYRGSHYPRDLRMHIQEFAENSADLRHFNCIHSSFTLPWTDIQVPGIKVNFEASWEKNAEHKHICHLYTDEWTTLFGYQVMGKGCVTAKVWFLGPAGMVLFELRTKWFGSVYMWQCHTPTQPMKLKTTFRWYSDRRMPRWMASFLVGSWVSQWQNDIFIWENKILLNPLLVKGDGPIMALRRWYKQFYPAPKIELEKPVAGSGTEKGSPAE